MSSHPALAPGRVAVITGAASGIGFAAAKKFAALGMKVAMADLDPDATRAAAAEVAHLSRAKGDVKGFAVDVSDPAAVVAFKDAVYAAFGEVALLMNNAGVGNGGGVFGDPERWRRLIDVNLFGVVNGVQAFGPSMVAQKTPAAIVNTGSKQGITCPPGDTAYNVSKAGVKVVTEALAYELANTPGCEVSAHLLIPGFTFTGMTAGSRTAKTAGRLDARSGRRFSRRQPRGRAFLCAVPGQRRHPRDRREAHPLGRRGHHFRPSGAFALAPGIQGGVRALHEGVRRRGRAVPSPLVGVGEGGVSASSGGVIPAPMGRRPRLRLRRRTAASYRDSSVLNPQASACRPSTSNRPPTASPAPSPRAASSRSSAR